MVDLAELWANLEPRLDRLLDRLMEGRVVPFLGAGVSLDARRPGDDEFQPTVHYLKVGLVGGLLDVLRRADISDAARAREIRTLCGKTDRTLAVAAAPTYEDCDRWIQDRAKAAELAPLASQLHQLAGAYSVGCEAAKIGLFAELAPLPAHRFLAYLLREQCVRWVWTTNYDCCVETAYADVAGDPPAVVSDVRGFQRLGTRGPALVKVNGCARRFQQAALGGRGAEEEDAARQIALTDGQLLRFWREREWARVQLAVLALNHSLLFCGFDGADPFLRCHLLDVWSSYSPTPLGGADPDAVLRQPNAPFVASYKELSGPQRQILYRYLISYVPERDVRPEHRFANAFEARDAPVLSAGSAREGLSADLFLGRSTGPGSAAACGRS